MTQGQTYQEDPSTELVYDIPQDSTVKKEEKSVSRKSLEAWSFYILLATVLLTPLIFWPSRYIPLDMIKTVVIVTGTVASVILFGIVAIREKRISLPPKSIFWTALLIIASLIISSLLSINIEKSLLGRGFEIGTAIFIAVLFLSSLVAFTLVSRRPERAVLLYVSLAAAYVVLYVFHLLRIIFGPQFVSFSILPSVTDSIAGNWYSLGIFSIVIALISLVAASVLPVTRRMKIAYCAFAVISIFGALLINMPLIWKPLVLVTLGLVIYLTAIQPRTGSGMGDFIKRLAWIPLIAMLVFVIFSWKGNDIAGPIVTKSYGGYSELALPWQMTLDVTAGVMKNYPLFGVGPNHFVQAFLTYKPMIINSTDAWNIEFTNGFGYIPTLFPAGGIVGIVLWILFFIFFGLSGSKALRRLPLDPTGRFLIVSSFASATFIWLTMLIYVPSHLIVFSAFLMTGIFFGSAVSFGSLAPYGFSAGLRPRWTRVYTLVILLAIIASALTGVIYVRKSAALAMFGRGLSELNKSGNPVLADNYFRKAQAFDSSDVFWQARAEASLLKAGKAASSVTAGASASSTQEALALVLKATNEALAHSRNAIAFDQANYYNYVSEARVSEVATGYGMDKAFENGVAAYQKAISLNPLNPALYLNLARFQASQNQLDDSLRTVGAALQVKNNYLDAIFLLSQIHAAKGNLNEAITAAKVATEINPQNPLLFFQLGLLEYNKKDYANASQALSKAVILQPDYANAKYFLGLTYSRLGQNAAAIEQFENLAITNPENSEVALILSNLQSGKPAFADAVPPVTSTPEKRSSLPIQETNR